MVVGRDHKATLVRHDDGRFEVQCPECRAQSDPPIGVNVPIHSPWEAEAILENHLGLTRHRVGHAGPVA